jgi:hypothetical protein
MRSFTRAFFFAGLTFLVTAPLARAEDIPLLPGKEDDSGTTDRPRSWEMPAVRGRGGPAPALREEELIGPYAQPRWTATRRFPTTRAYVVPEGKVEVELWARATVENDRIKYRFLQEFEVGLPYRFQFDVYLRQELVDLDPDTTGTAAQVELRWALADWGELFANPTLYFEYLLKDGAPDAIEPKLLFAGELAQGWHAALNFTLEHEVSGELEREFGIRGGLSYTVVDSRMGLGAEAVINAVDVAGARGDFEWEAFLGPSLQWKPVDILTLNLVPLFGLVTGGPLAQIYVNIGVEI